jgi:hypothetical protein
MMMTFSVPTFAEPAVVKDVIDQLITSYGGEDNLRKLDQMTQEWSLVAKMGNRHGTDTRYIRAPGQLRVDLNYPGKSETRILDNDKAYVLFGGKNTGAVSAMQQDAMRLQLMRLYSPLMLRNKIGSVGLKEEGGMLALSLVEHGVHVFYLVNKENWRIEKVAGSLLVNGREIQFLTEYSDFAFVEGVLIHRAENKFASGMNTAVLKLSRITFSDEIDDDLFIP